MFGPPSTVKAWVDHIIATGLSIDAETHTGLLGDTDFVVLASRGGGYCPTRRAKAGTMLRPGYHTPYR
jgi:FMN-dependent NADH-azoreductase